MLLAVLIVFAFSIAIVLLVPFVLFIVLFVSANVFVFLYALVLSVYLLRGFCCLSVCRLSHNASTTWASHGENSRSC